jgi:hypothetical protein
MEPGFTIVSSVIDFLGAWDVAFYFQIQSI